MKWLSDLEWWLEWDWERVQQKSLEKPVENRLSFDPIETIYVTESAHDTLKLKSIIKLKQNMNERAQALCQNCLKIVFGAAEEWTGGSECNWWFLPVFILKWVKCTQIDEVL